MRELNQLDQTAKNRQAIFKSTPEIGASRIEASKNAEKYKAALQFWKRRALKWAGDDENAFFHLFSLRMEQLAEYAKESEEAAQEMGEALSVLHQVFDLTEDQLHRLD